MNNFFVERETFETNGKTYFTCFVRGNVRGKDVKECVVLHVSSLGNDRKLFVHKSIYGRIATGILGSGRQRFMRHYPHRFFRGTKAYIATVYDRRNGDR